MRTDTSAQTEFRIRVIPGSTQHKINEYNKSDAALSADEDDCIERTQAIFEEDDLHPRVLLGSPVAAAGDAWVTTSKADFSTITFGPVFDLFRAALGDQAQTGLVVTRMFFRAPGPAHTAFGTDALRVLQEENAGGASEYSEALSFEFLSRVFHARLAKTEMAIRYRWGRWSKKTDYSCFIDGRLVAVSVTRAMRFHGTFTEADAFALLAKKLYGCQMSNRDVVDDDRWTKQILHILTETLDAVELLRSVFQWMLTNQPELVGNTVVLVTLTTNAPFVYFNFCAAQAEMQFITDVQTATKAQTDVFARPAQANDAPMQLDFAIQKQEFSFGFKASDAMLEHDALVVIDGLSSEEKGEDSPAPLAPLERLWASHGLEALGVELKAGSLDCPASRAFIGALAQAGFTELAGMDEDEGDDEAAAWLWNALRDDDAEEEDATDVFALTEDVAEDDIMSDVHRTVGADEEVVVGNMDDERMPSFTCRGENSCLNPLRPSPPHRQQQMQPNLNLNPHGVIEHDVASVYFSLSDLARAYISSSKSTKIGASADNLHCAKGKTSESKWKMALRSSYHPSAPAAAIHHMSRSLRASLRTATMAAAFDVAIPSAQPRISDFMRPYAFIDDAEDEPREGEEDNDMYGAIGRLFASGDIDAIAC